MQDNKESKANLHQSLNTIKTYLGHNHYGLFITDTVGIKNTQTIYEFAIQRLLNDMEKRRNRK